MMFLFDMSEVTLMHLTRINLRSIKRFFNYVNNCLPAQFHEVHVINTVPFFDKVMPLIKPFLKVGGIEKVNFLCAQTLCCVHDEINILFI